MAKAIPFTAQTLAHLKPRETDYDVYEAGSTGLFLRVRPSGTKSFRWDCRSRGKLITIGRFGDGTGGTITLAQARARLEQLKAKVAAGLDPEGVDGEERPRTVKQLCEVFYRESLLKRRKRPQEALVVLEQKIIPVIGSLPLSAVDTLAARRPTVKVVEAGFPARAAKVLQVTKQLFGFAAEHGFMPNNPAAPLKADSLGIVANKRDRWLTAEEIPELLRAVDSSPMEASVRLGLRFLFFTGLRTGE
ncbi:MAG: tyrosine-type recombinase/integrase, partial [Myxococcales bacterium]